AYVGPVARIEPDSPRQNAPASHGNLGDRVRPVRSCPGMEIAAPDVDIGARNAGPSFIDDSPGDRSGLVAEDIELSFGPDRACVRGSREAGEADEPVAALVERIRPRERDAEASHHGLGTDADGTNEHRSDSPAQGERGGIVRGL